MTNEFYCLHYAAVLFRDLCFLCFRDESFLITHCPVVWTSSDRYNFIRKLGEYRDFNKRYYESLVSDTLEQAIPIDFWTRIQTATPSSSASKLQRLYYHDNADTRTYLSTESIRHFHRCGYEHKTVSSMFYIIIFKMNI